MKHYSAEQKAKFMSAVNARVQRGEVLEHACRAEGVSLSSYYFWRQKKKVGPKPKAKPAPKKKSSIPKFDRVHRAAGRE